MDLHSDYPFWMIKEGILQSFPTINENTATEVLVIGGGITGALVAHFIAASGLKVIVVDKRHIAHGSTSASTSMLQYEIDIPLFRLIKMVGKPKAVRAYQLCAEAIDKIGNLAAGFSGAADFHKYPSVFYASFEKHTESIIRPEFEARSKHGFDVTLWDSAQVQKNMGFKAPSAIYSTQGGQINPYKICNYLLADLVKKGHRVFDLTEIAHWEAGRKGVLAQTKNGFEIEAKHIVVACGYESQSYVKEKVTRFHSSYAIVSKPLDRRKMWKNNALIWETKTPYLYMRTTGDNRILVGGRDENFYAPDRRDHLIPQKRVQLEQDFKNLFPEIPFQVDFAWAGTFAETADGLPYIGSVDSSRVHFAMGYGGNGIVFSVVAAEIIRDAIHGKKNKDAAIFKFGRGSK